MQNNKWIVNGLKKLYIHVLIDIFMYTAANARWHFETKLRIQVHVLMKIAGGVQYMICDGTNSEHIVLAQSQYAGPNYIQANVGTSISLSHIHGIQDQNVQTIKVFLFARQYCEFSVIAIGEIK